MRFKFEGGFRAASIGLGAVLAVWGGLWAYPKIMIGSYKLKSVKPGKINLLAVPVTSGYRIIVSNGIAHLVEIQGDPAKFDAPDDPGGMADAARLPIRETLQALQGDTNALGKMVMSVNKMSEDDLPNVRIVWKAEDVQKALDGDVALRDKLERDLNTKLDGSPLDTLNLQAILSGIVLDEPVDVQVPVSGKMETLRCRVLEPYKSLFAGAVEKKINERFNISHEALIGFYRDAANKIYNGGRKEDVASSLKARIVPNALKQKAAAPEKILANMTVLVNEDQMSGASYVTFHGPNRSILCNVTLRLTDEGKNQLWKYSHENPGFQLLLTVDGVAIAAPRIKTELADNSVNLTRVPSTDQVDDAVSVINKTASGSK